MDSLVRHLRDGAVQDGGPAALVVICDTLGVVGGQALFKQVWQLTRASSSLALISSAWERGTRSCNTGAVHQRACHLNAGAAGVLQGSGAEACTSASCAHGVLDCAWACPERRGQRFIQPAAGQHRGPLHRPVGLAEVSGMHACTSWVG